YQMATVANVDHSGRFASLLPAAQGLGQIIGPNLAASALALGNGYDPVFLLCAAASLAAFAIYAGLYLRLRHTLPALADAS
ncbi:MAG: MFS transporter, partial [Haliea sp.]